MNNLNQLSRAEMKDVKKLTRSEMKNVVGGCCWHDGDLRQCGLTKKDAQTISHETGVMWCCQSC